MTDLQNKIIEFIKSSQNKGKRYLTEFESIIIVKSNIRYHHSVRAGILGKMVNKGLIKTDSDKSLNEKVKNIRTRNTIYYYL